MRNRTGGMQKSAFVAAEGNSQPGALFVVKQRMGCRRTDAPRVRALRAVAIALALARRRLGARRNRSFNAGSRKPAPFKRIVKGAAPPRSLRLKGCATRSTIKSH